MKTSPYRIAALALTVLLLAGFMAWWWQGHDTRRVSAFPSSAGHVAIDLPSGTGVPAPDSQALPASMSAALATCSRAIVAAFSARALELRQAQDARSQLAYALASPMDLFIDPERMSADEQQRVTKERDSEARAALLRAAALAPDDPDVLWLVASQCGGGGECLAVQQALLAAEPANAAVWLREMGWARMRGDPAASQTAFQHAAAASGYDTHRSATDAMMRHGYAEVPMPAVCLHPDVPKAAALWRTQTGMPAPVGELGVLDHALGLANMNKMMAVPAYIDIRQQCGPTTDHPMLPEKYAACRRVMTWMADGETLIELAVSLDAMVRLTADAPDAAQWRERYRQNRWLVQQQSDIAFHALLRPEDYADGEVPALQAMLEAVDRWPPPADWLPEDEDSRSLILTGRPPAEKKRN